MHHGQPFSTKSADPRFLSRNESKLRGERFAINFYHILDYVVVIRQFCMYSLCIGLFYFQIFNNYKLANCN